MNVFKNRMRLLVLGIFFVSAPAFSQSISSRGGINETLPDFQPHSSYFGGVARGQAVSGVLPLSLSNAVDRGLKNNLGALLSSDAITEARGRRWQRLSALLPTVATETSFSTHQLDLKAQIGLQIRGVPSVIGPFGVFDTRASLKQPVFDWKSIEQEKSSREQLKGATYSYRNARELVVLAVTSSYLLAIAEESRVDSATAQRDTAEALYQQTADQKKAGVAAAVDVLRSNVELQAREQDLIVAKNKLAKQKLVLARAIGLPAEQQFKLTTEVAYQALPTVSLADALSRAYSLRPDYRSAIAEARAAEWETKAAAAERYPSVAVEADYGDIGVNPASSHGTVNAEAVVKIPIFQGGKVHGDVLQADGELRRARQGLEDLRGQINQEVQDSLLDLQASEDEVAVEKNAVTLADRTLQQARDRFASGVTDNIEVVQAQDSVASTEESYIASLYSYNLAKISLARAMGTAESNFANYLKGN
ncbi:MAG TPA: TolC family protein [Candidatus Acidoferrales bacterium]|nr:TolC family protein [Candidatus Acidoferrales bacterium]